MRILNVGCGNDDYGTDRIDLMESETTTKVYDIEEGLPYEENTFDEVFCQYVWEHIKNPYNLLLEMKRVCKVGGEIHVITDNAGYILFHVKWRGRDYHGNYVDAIERTENNKLDKHYGLYQPEHIRNCFETAGLEVTCEDFKFWHNVKTKKSIIFHYVILRRLFGERFSMPSVEVVGVKK